MAKVMASVAECHIQFLLDKTRNVLEIWRREELFPAGVLNQMYTALGLTPEAAAAAAAAAPLPQDDSDYDPFDYQTVQVTQVCSANQQEQLAWYQQEQFAW